jgi:gamma-glutamyl-gamma-aminobutyrate hydrolase PuuD
MDKKILGVCRGSQFLSVMQKASLWQDIEGHGRSHFCDIDQNLHPEFPEKILITSSHHQCLNYNSVKNREDFVLHGSTLGFVNPDLTGIDNENHVEVIPEFFQFGYNILCIQSHPEYVCMAHTNYIEKGFEKYITFCRKLVNNLMIDKI